MTKLIYQTIFMIAILQFAIINTHAAPMIVRIDARQDYYPGDGNPTENDWCFEILHPTRVYDCYKANQLADEALKSAKENYPKSLHNGPGDAYRHCYWSGLLTFEFGEAEAKGFGDRHEDDPNNPPNEKAMDLYNNNVGRTIAKTIRKGDKNAMSAACKRAVSDGRLKTLS